MCEIDTGVENGVENGVDFVEHDVGRVGGCVVANALVDDEDILDGESRDVAADDDFDNDEDDQIAGTRAR